MKKKKTQTLRLQCYNQLSRGNTLCTSKPGWFPIFNTLGKIHSAAFLCVTRAFAVFVLASKLQLRVTLDSILRAARVMRRWAACGTRVWGSGGLVLWAGKVGTHASAEQLFPLLPSLVHFF